LARGIRPSCTILSKVPGATLRYAAAASRLINRGGKSGGNAACRAIYDPIAAERNDDMFGPNTSRHPSRLPLITLVGCISNFSAKWRFAKLLIGRATAE
jgi:hypothetical protein